MTPDDVLCGSNGEGVHLHIGTLSRPTLTNQHDTMPRLLHFMHLNDLREKEREKVEREGGRKIGRKVRREGGMTGGKKERNKKKSREERKIG